MDQNKIQDKAYLILAEIKAKTGACFAVDQMERLLSIATFDPEKAKAIFKLKAPKPHTATLKCPHCGEKITLELTVITGCPHCRGIINFCELCSERYNSSSICFDCINCYSFKPIKKLKKEVSK